MLPSETPRVLHQGNGTRGPFSLSVDGTAISFASSSHIKVWRIDADGVKTLQVEGTHYDLSASSALPDLNDVLRPVSTATLSFKLAQPVLAADEYVLIERDAPASQDLALATGGGFSSKSAERTFDAIVRLIQQLFTKSERGVYVNSTDDDGALELPPVAERAGKFVTFDEDGNFDVAVGEGGSGDLVSTNNLSDLDDAATARTNLGLGSAATLAQSAVFKVANNLSEGVAGTMRSNLGLGALAVMSDGDEIDVTATGGSTERSLADWFDGLGKDEDEVTIGAFWLDQSAATRIWRFRDRVFIGEAADATGDRDPPHGSYLSTSSAGANWALRASQFLVMADAGGGGMAVTGISRSSDPDATYGVSIGVSGFLINDKASGSGWALYADIQHENGAGSSIGLEVAAKNKGADRANTPYGVNQGGVYGLWLAGGGDNAYAGSAANPANTAITILKNDDYGWNVGISFKDGGLSVSGGLSKAIELPANYALNFYRSDDTVAGRLYSTTTTASIQQQLIFTNSGFQITGPSAENIARFVHNASAVNSIDIHNGATGVAPAIHAYSATDTNVELTLRSQNAAPVVASRDDSSTNTAAAALVVRRSSSGTPATGIGAAIGFSVETSAGNFETGMTLEAVTTDVTGASEDFDLVAKLMAGGSAATEAFRVRSTGALVPANARLSAAEMGVGYVYKSGVQATRASVNGAGDATEAIIATITVPANAIGPNGAVRVTASFDCADSASSKTYRIRFGGLSGPVIQTQTQTTSAAVRLQGLVWNRNSTSSQTFSLNAASTGGWTASTQHGAGSIDTTASVNIVLTGAWGGAISGETMSVENYMVEVFYGA